MIKVLPGVLVALMVHCAAGQSPMRDSIAVPPPNITIITNPDSALVILDSTRQGATPLTFSTTPGWHSLTLSHPDISNWLTSTIRDSIFLTPGEHKTLRYAFEKRYLITSEPFNATVLLGDSIIGLTPLLVSEREVNDRGDLTLRKPGFEERTVSALSAHRGILQVTLQNDWQRNGYDETLLKNSARSDRALLPMYVAGAATVLFGATAAYFKIKADDRFDSYLQTGNPALLDQTRRMDTGAAIALIATQASAGLLAYFMLSD